MFMFTLRSLPVVFALCFLAACGYTPPKPVSTAKDPQSAYAEAKELLDSGSYESAITGYEQLEARFPYGKHAQQAQLDTAYAHYRLHESDATIADCDRFIRLHPNHPNVDYAYYLKGLSYENTNNGDWLSFLPQQPLSDRDATAMNNAFETFKILVTRYPDSRYIEDARIHLQTLLEALAKHELNAAHYYLNRRAPLAAANRAQIVISKYSSAGATEEALAVLLQSYQALELDTLSKDTERVLRQNYPQSRFLVQK
jgi:outer membrane protein assembly factor BamD